MRLLGFSIKIFKYMKRCINIVSYSILLHGSPFGNIKPRRSLRQEDPISLYLFVIIVEFYPISSKKMENLNAWFMEFK